MSPQSTKALGIDLGTTNSCVAVIEEGGPTVIHTREGGRTLPSIVAWTKKGVLVGDAATRLKQTLMFDLPIVDKDEVQALMRQDVLGGGKRTAR